MQSATRYTVITILRFSENAVFLSGFYKRREKIDKSKFVTKLVGIIVMIIF